MRRKQQVADLQEAVRQLYGWIQMFDPDDFEHEVGDYITEVGAQNEALKAVYLHD